ncbi:MAG: hypothetical protein QME96_15735 [Myxococcota bacterium]|nr:hypothetical protein [Myxococcota bacterium]
MDGRSIAGGVARRIARMPVREARSLVERVRRESLEFGVTYQPEGKPVEVTDLVLAPIVLGPGNLRALRTVALTMSGIVGRLAAWRERIPDVHALLPLEPTEEEWFRDCAPPGSARAARIIGRWDMNVEQFGDGRLRIRLFEGNGVAIGGLNYGPAAERIVSGYANDLLGATVAGRIRLGPLCDLHGALFRTFRDQAARIGRRFRTLAWLEDKTWDAGITEAPYVMESMRRRGVRAFLADPRDLRVRRGEVFHGDDEVDVIYRNIELRDITELERSDGPLDALRLAFRRNQVASPLAGELDHKSILAVPRVPVVWDRLSRAERRTVAACVPWTRMVRAERIDGPAGRRVDLPEHVRRNRRSLVLKPNRGCGGDGVTIGRAVSQAAWEKTLRDALREEGTWVVQEHVRPVRIPFPQVGRRVGIAGRYANCGVIALPHGTGILGRASARPVVNVAQGGGIVALLLARAAR